MSENKMKIDISAAYNILGGQGEPDIKSRILLEEAAEEVLKVSTPRIIDRVCHIEKGNRLFLRDTFIELNGRAIKALLHACDRSLIFCATLGADVDALIRQWQVRDISFALALDACANLAVESLCDIKNDAIKIEYELNELYVTDRFSPGYGDFPLETQSSLCAALDTARKIGVFLSESNLMIPQKSITAVIGISESPQKSRNSGCLGCIKFNSCRFRERGITCYGQAI
ncbi:MAG TPA: vitamin B12 dependent-methionine synthase activation domain-containing protein [Clostridia bacterium]|nr:vitamin B12 dependent-methionine synthase activation domain-containing protein [Clostridia bacterium]